MSFEEPYSGLKVIDLSQGIAGPYCAMLLAQWGADVIKIEPPEGDWARMLGPRYGDHTAFSVAGNIGKRALALDLKSAAGKTALEKVIAGADVFIEGFRPGVIDRLGLGYERVKTLSPGIIYVSISGYGQTGPLAHKPAMDPILQAYTGFMTANADGSGTPMRAQPIIVDMTTALYAYQAVAASLFAKRDDPKPRYLDISLMAAAANLQVVRFMSTLQEGAEPPPGSTPSGVYRTKDGFTHILILKERDWLSFCDALDLKDFKANKDYRDNRKRAADQAKINARIEPVLLSKSSAEWSELFTALGLMNTPVLDYLQFAAEPQAIETNLITNLPQPGYPAAPTMLNIPGHPPLKPFTDKATAPVLGRNTREILAEAGMQAEEVDSLIQSGIAIAAD